MLALEKCRKFLEEFYTDADNIKTYTYADQLVRIFSSASYYIFLFLLWDRQIWRTENKLILS